MDQAEKGAAEERLRRAIEAYHEAALVYAAVKLGLAEKMGEREWPVEELAHALGLSPPHLARFLRGLSIIGICEERAGGGFTLTPLGRSLTSAAQLAAKVQIVVEQYWQPWANLASTLQTGRPAFEQVFGTSVFDWRRAHAKQGALFDSYLAQETGGQLNAVIDSLDFSGVGTVAILQAQSQFADASFDGTHMVAMSQPFMRLLDVARRVEFVPGNLLEGIPVKAELYLLMGVLQQYGDADALTVLRNCRLAMPEGSRLAIIERLLPERAEDDAAAVMLDLHMMVVTGGRARTRDEMQALLASAGLSVTRVSVACNGLSLIEARPSRSGQAPSRR
jgi:hypothetical protein